MIHKKSMSDRPVGLSLLMLLPAAWGEQKTDTPDTRFLTEVKRLWERAN